MSRITKAIDDSVTAQLLNNRLKEVDEAELFAKKHVEEIYMSYIPKNVKEVFKEYPQYFDTTNGVYINGAGLSHGKRYMLVNQVPDKSGNIKVSNGDADAILIVTDRYEDLNKKYNQDYKTIYNTLINIGTYKKCQDVFPEAYMLLPTSKDMGVALNIDEALKIIRS